MILHLLPYRLKARLLPHRPVVWLLNILFLFLVFFTAHFFLFKLSENVSWQESLWQTWQTFTTVGYGNRPAETTAGRWVTILTSTTGIALLGILFSAVVDLNLWQKERRRNGFMKNKFSNGYVIINYPGDVTFNDLIKEIRFLEKDVGICVVDGKISSLPPSVEHIKNIHFISGSIYEQETYRNANIKNNKTVIIFPVRENEVDSDGITRTIVDGVNRFIRENTRILHVLVDPRNNWMFENTGSVQVLRNLNVLALVQECQDRYSSAIIENLLLNTEDANPKTVLPEKICGWTWEELTLHSIQAAKNLKRIVNLLALVKNGKTSSCPPFDMLIEKGDAISIITYKSIDWGEFEDELIRCRK